MTPPRNRTIALISGLILLAGCWPWAGEDLTAVGERVAYHAVFSGPGGSCALDADGLAYCWGSGELGTIRSTESCSDGADRNTGVVGDDYTCTRRPLPVWDADGDARFTQLTLSATFRCGLDADGAPWCWGTGPEDASGRLQAEFLAEPRTSVPRLATAIPEGVHFQQLASGNAFTCGLSTDGQVWCWGNANAVTLLPAEEFSPACAACPNACDACAVAPRVRPEPLRYMQISAGDESLCGLTTDGDAYCWGTGAMGVDPAPDQCTYESHSPQPCALVPGKVPGGIHFRQLASRGTTTCGVSLDGELSCWSLGGWNVPTIGRTPTRITGPAIVSVTLGSNFGCGLTDDHQVLCFGRDNFDPAFTRDPSVLAAIDTPMRFTALSAGPSHVCGLTTGGDVACWGTNFGGTLGLGTQRGTTSTPAVVSNPWRD